MILNSGLLGFQTPKTKCLSIAHKGLHTQAAENSLNAFKDAIAAGFDGIETDVQYSSDNIPVLSHNSTIGTFTISEHTAAEAVSQKNLTLLSEAMDLCAEKNRLMFIEHKAGTENQIHNTVAMAKQKGVLGNIVWIDFNITRLSYVASAPDANEPFLGYLRDGGTVSVSSIRDIKNLSPNGFIDAGYAEDKYLRENDLAKENNCLIGWWTINDVEIAKTLDQLDAYSITSDSVIIKDVMA